ncbi:transcriptional regulator [Acidovorax sp. Leaf76]|uniref:type II toxin-antitoxin system HipA family toxin YjjJ n=1 Tax=unclassified Acidovorax TaxID=2684926 RepID=UPI0006FCE51D|nr:MULTISPECIES: type II toxin-antitoxin system HipA family toxin YjjJ [unclassified Acidovorax]KQO26876.1 transcriptional regulator [Acidovorax sp. Leaf76]KQO40644.1 transcriptional regulator [Acidovorax sp. Leaf84]KQS42789.1 transcriptional regulator [Acidovorax sp. Leaf191]
MARAPDLTSKALAALRRQGGVLTSAELQELLGVSQPTVSRALAPLIHGGQVQKVGAARSQRYVLPRTVPNVGNEVLVMRIDAHGRPSPFARMVPLEGGAFWVDEADGVSARHDGLPWFLDDMRPQGFMGRTFAHAHPELQLGHDPGHWSDDDVLRAMTLYGDDLPGNLIMGEAAFQRFHTLPARASRVDSAAAYPALAEQAMRGTHPGSSAGGEQPKFCTITAGRHVIVKFSPAGDAPADQRLRDLLVCEHLALQTLAQAGLPAAPTQLFMDAGRVFLESERFDRTPLTWQGTDSLGGRIGMVSLQVYNAEYVGEIDNWAATANRMAARHLLTPADARTLRLLEAYGQLIANTDRHYGNISLVLKDDDWALSPTYDMLPMLYAPVGGELVPRDFASRPLQPTAATLSEWADARGLALAFWRAAAADARVSAQFRDIAAENAGHIGHIGR